jgi:hypothetical protein
LKNSTPCFGVVECKSGKDADHEAISSPRRVGFGDRAGGARMGRGTDSVARSVRSRHYSKSTE